MKRKGRRPAFFLLAVLCFFQGTSFALPLEDGEVFQRINDIQARLDQGTRQARIWQYSWMVVYGLAAFVQIGLTETMDAPEEKEDRFDSTVSGVTALVGMADLAVNPLRAYNAADKLRATPEVSEEQRQEKLRKAEKLLSKLAERETFGRSWKYHAGVLLVNLAAGTIIGLDGGRWEDGAINFGTGLLVSEIQIFTTPRQAIRDWEAYKRKYSIQSTAGKLSGKGSGINKKLILSALPKGVMLTVTF